MTGVEKGILQQTKYCIKWKIERFFADCEKVNDFYTSPEFLIPHANEMTKWFIKVFPKNYKEENQDYIGMWLNFRSENISEIKVDFELSIVSMMENVDPEKINQSAIISFKGPKYNWGWGKFVGHDFIKDETNGILIDDTLTIQCKIRFPHENVDLAKKPKDYNNMLNQIGKGLQNYEEAFESNHFSDVTFIVQDQKICLHKAILMCRNPVFKAMFEPKENTAKKQKLMDDLVEITDVNYKVMKEVFRFIYSGKVENIDEIAKDLLYAADKYKVAELKTLCEITLANNLHIDLTIDTIMDYLKLANICETSRLKTSIIQFAVDHRKEVIKKPEFQDLDKSVIIKIVQEIVEKE